jgi:hypothetical protein
MGLPDVHETFRQAEWLPPHGTGPEADRPTGERFGRATAGDYPPMKDHADVRPGARPAASAPTPFVTRPGPVVRTSLAAEPMFMTTTPVFPSDPDEPELSALLAQVVRRFRQSPDEARAEFDIDGMHVTLEDSFLGQLGPIAGH